MLTKITKEFYIDLEKISYVFIDRCEKKCFIFFVNNEQYSTIGIELATTLLAKIDEENNYAGYAEDKNRGL